jgi:hypothetical protein
MFTRVISVAIRLSVGILVILNGPANALALVAVSPQACPCTPDASAQASPKKCCGRCAKDAHSKRNGQRPSKDNANKIRPTCPACPSCPNYPDGCCLSCPLKAPCAPPLVFVMPDAPEIVWPLAEEDISFSDSHADELLLPPRCSQFVAFTI